MKQDKREGPNLRKFIFVFWTTGTSWDVERARLWGGWAIGLEAAMMAFLREHPEAVGVRLVRWE